MSQSDSGVSRSVRNVGPFVLHPMIRNNVKCGHYFAMLTHDYYQIVEFKIRFVYDNYHWHVPRQDTPMTTSCGTFVQRARADDFR